MLSHCRKESKTLHGYILQQNIEQNIRALALKCRWEINASLGELQTSRSQVASCVRDGWIDEGVVMCAPL